MAYCLGAPLSTAGPWERHWQILSGHRSYLRGQKTKMAALWRFITVMRGQTDASRAGRMEPRALQELPPRLGGCVRSREHALHPSPSTAQEIGMCVRERSTGRITAVDGGRACTHTLRLLPVVCLRIFPKAFRPFKHELPILLAGPRNDAALSSTITRGQWGGFTGLGKQTQVWVSNSSEHCGVNGPAQLLSGLQPAWEPVEQAVGAGASAGRGQPGD